MVQLTCIYTRSGDKGKTSLGNGARVAKADLRVEAYGTVDETNAILGVVRVHTQAAEAGSRLAEADGMIVRLQNDLFDLGADLCFPEQEGDQTRLRISLTQVERLEREIDKMNGTLEPLKSFVLPGGGVAAAHLHLARTVSRRAERIMTLLAGRDPLNPHALAYLNRLSDHLFVLARYVAAQTGGDVLWVPGGNQDVDG